MTPLARPRRSLPASDFAQRLAQRLALGLACLLALAGCAAPQRDEGVPGVGTLHLIGQQLLPWRMTVQGTTVGGLSGIDHDPARQAFVMISDDRSARDTPDPARLYWARLHYDLQGFHAVEMLSSVPLRQADGSTHAKLPEADAPDPEGVRIDRATGHLVWISEGDRVTAAEGPAESLVQPFIREARQDGHPLRDYELPAMFRIQAQAAGPRRNAVFEGLSFSADGRELAVMMEGPRFEDGPAPSPGQGGLARLSFFDRASGRLLRQHAVELDPVRTAPSPPAGFSVNGATEILALDATRYLMLERSYAAGDVDYRVQLHVIDTRGADEVQDRPRLVPGGQVPVRKHLLLDFDRLRGRLGGIANLEGLSWGPRLANGHASLVVVADDNFTPRPSARDRNQILVFELRP